jgi:hypothetical protein
MKKNLFAATMLALIPILYCACSMAGEMTKNKITNVLISLEVDNKQSLFILLASDGTVNRLGNGTVNNEDNDMYIGISNEKLFEKLMKRIPDDLFEYQGVYDIPDKKGKNCKLTLLFGGKEDNEAIGFKFLYGSESQGPPSEISEIVINAVNITEPWYLKHKKIAQ